MSHESTNTFCKLINQPNQSYSLLGGRSNKKRRVNKGKEKKKVVITAEERLEEKRAKESCSNYVNLPHTLILYFILQARGGPFKLLEVLAVVSFPLNCKSAGIFMELWGNPDQRQ